MGRVLKQRMRRRANGDPRRDPGLREVIALWALYGWEAAAVFLTYANASTARVRASGPFDAARGCAQVLVFLRHPTLPAAVAFAPIAWCRLPAAARPRAVRAATTGGVATCLTLTAIKARGRQTPSTKDTIAVSSVAAVLGLTVSSAHSAGIGAAPVWSRDDIVRVATAAGFVVPALPWILADLGVSVTDLRVVGRVFLAEERLPTGAVLPAVHLGHHHGIDGVLLALTGLTLSRTLDRVRPPAVRSGLSLYLAGLVVYGTLRAAEDVWNEQVVKRGWTKRKVPLIVSGGRPARPGVWAGMLLAATMLHRRRRPDHALNGDRPSGPSS